MKKTMKCDPAVKNVQREALSVMAKATELFVAYIARRCGAAAAKRGVKTVKSTDLVKAIHDDDALCFLTEDFPKSLLKTKSTKRSVESEEIENSGEFSERKVRKLENVASGKSSLLNYFGGQKQTSS